MSAPHTHDLLRGLVRMTKGPKNWYFRVKDDGAGHLTLIITVDGTDNYDYTKHFSVGHCHPVPHADYNEATWREWIFAQCERTFRHELGEQLRFGPDAERPFEPCHAPGEDPYSVHKFRPAIDALTTQDGSVREPANNLRLAETFKPISTDTVHDLLDKHMGRGWREVEPDLPEYVRKMIDEHTGARS